MSMLTQLKKKVDKYMGEADQRAEKRLIKARTQAERDRVRSILRTDKMAIKQQESEARASLLKAQAAEKVAEAAKRRAAKEVRDVGGGFSLASLFGSSKTAPKHTGRRHTIRKHTTIKHRRA